MRRAQCIAEIESPMVCVCVCSSPAIKWYNKSILCWGMATTPTATTTISHTYLTQLRHSNGDSEDKNIFFFFSNIIASNSNNNNDNNKRWKFSCTKSEKWYCPAFQRHIYIYTHIAHRAPITYDIHCRWWITTHRHACVWTPTRHIQLFYLNENVEKKKHNILIITVRTT